MWKQITSKDHCPNHRTDKPGCNTSHWVYEISKTKKLSIYSVDLPIVPPHNTSGELAFCYVSSCGADSENSYGGMVYALTLDEAKDKIITEYKNQKK